VRSQTESPALFEGEGEGFRPVCKNSVGVPRLSAVPVLNGLSSDVRFKVLNRREIAHGRDIHDPSPLFRKQVDQDFLRGKTLNLNRGHCPYTPLPSGAYNMSDSTTTITLEEYLDLLIAQEKLACLEAAGVDNWSGMGEAMASEEAQALKALRALSRKARNGQELTVADIHACL
jgi:hypothetical protein